MLANRSPSKIKQLARYVIKIRAGIDQEAKLHVSVAIVLEVQDLARSAPLRRLIRRLTCRGWTGTGWYPTKPST